MGAFLTTTNRILDWFGSHPIIEEVTHGDIGEVDLSSHTSFPLAHIIYLDTSYDEGVTQFTYQILLLDTYTEGTDDKIEVLDRMSEVATEFMSGIYRGSLFNSLIRVNTVPTSAIMYDQLGNNLYGISLQVDIKVPNGIVICP